MYKTVTLKAVAKVAAVATGLAMATSMLSLAPMAYASSLTSAQVQSILSLLSSFGASSSTIANVNAALTGSTMTTTTTSTGSMSAACSFTMNLTIGSTGSEVTCLQQALIAAGYSIPAGATGYFGTQTQAAVGAWQKANGISPDAGYFGSISRAHWNLGGGTTTTTTTTGTGTTTMSGTNLSVSLSPTSPSGTVLVEGQGIGDLGDYVFTNPSASPITVTGLTFNRTGASNDSTINNVYLFNGMTRITDSAGVSNGQFSYTDSAGLFVVPANSSYTVSVRADIASAAEENTSGQQIGVSLVSVASSGTLASSVSFPIASGLQTISAATIATAQFNSTTLPTGTQQISPQSAYTVWQNTVSISQNPVWFKTLTLTNLGSISASDVQNLILTVDGTQVGSAVSQIGANRTVTFDLTNGGTTNGTELQTGSHVLAVTANIVGGSSLTFQFSLQYPSDAYFVDSELNQPLQPTSNGSSTHFTPVQSGIVTVQGVAQGGVSVNRDPGSTTNNIAYGASNVNLGTFDFLATGEPTKVTDLYVCANTAGTDVSAGNTGLANGELIFNGVQVGSTKNISECGSGSTDFSLGSSMILPAGTNATLEVEANAEGTSNTYLANGDSVQIELTAGTSNAQGQDSFDSVNVPGSTVTANTLTVTNASLTAAEATGYGNQTTIPGTQAFKVGSFSLTAGSTENLNVNSIGIDIGGNASSTLASLQNLHLVNDSTDATIGSTISTPSASNTFSTSGLVIPQSSTITIDVYANIPLSAVNGAQYQLSVDHAATNATGATTGTTATIGTSNVTLQNIVIGSGSLAVATGASNPVAANVIAGASNIEVGDYTFSANTSNYTVKNLEVAIPTSPTNDAAAVSSVSLQYKNASGVTQTVSSALNTAASTNAAVATFTGLNFMVPANNSADVSVWVSTPTIITGTTTISGTPIVATLVGTDGTNVQVQDASGNVTNSINGGISISSNTNSGYGMLVLRKSIPTFAGQSSSSNVAPTTNTTLYEFSISADAAGPVDFDQIAFQVATSTGGINATNFMLYNAANPSQALNGTGANASSGGIVKIVPTQVIQIGAGDTNTYILRATIGGTWASGSSLSVTLAPASATLISNAAATSLTGTSNYVWTDRAANNDSLSSTQWTNGCLLNDLVDGTYSFNYQS